MRLYRASLPTVKWLINVDIQHLSPEKTDRGEKGKTVNKQIPEAPFPHFCPSVPCSPFSVIQQPVSTMSLYSSQQLLKLSWKLPTILPKYPSHSKYQSHLCTNNLYKVLVLPWDWFTILCSLIMINCLTQTLQGAKLPSVPFVHTVPLPKMPSLLCSEWQQTLQIHTPGPTAALQNQNPLSRCSLRPLHYSIRKHFPKSRTTFLPTKPKANQTLVTEWHLPPLHTRKVAPTSKIQKQILSHSTLSPINPTTLLFIILYILLVSSFWVQKFSLKIHTA